MNASKENARKAKRMLEELSDKGSDDPSPKVFISRFLDACVTRLPREESYKRDRKRRKEKATASR